MSASQRLARVERQIIRDTTSIILEELKDPRIGFVTITGARLTPDFHYVKIFVSSLGTPEQQEASLAALKHSEHFVRGRLGLRMRLRYTPEISFMKDDSLEHTTRIYKLIDEVKEKDEHVRKRRERALRKK